MVTTVLETGQFDAHLMKNPALANEKVRHWGYQRGINYGFENTKAMVLNWKMYTIKPCREGYRTRSINELLFCMLRSKHSDTNKIQDD